MLYLFCLLLVMICSDLSRFNEMQHSEKQNEKNGRSRGRCITFPFVIEFGRSVVSIFYSRFTSIWKNLRFANYLDTILERLISTTTMAGYEIKHKSYITPTNLCSCRVAAFQIFKYCNLKITTNMTRSTKKGWWHP